MLEVGNIHAGYGDTEVLRGMDIRVEKSEIVAVLGPNGAGKTTLNNVLSGLLRASRGSVRFRGRDITRDRSTQIVAAGLIHVPEGRRIFPNLTVRENLELGSYRRGRAHRARNLQRVGDLFPKLSQRWSQLAGSLSGGEQQMVAIGRGMMADPELIILDEPSLGLAPVMVQALFGLIRRLHREGLAILLVEQNVARSLEVADRAYVLNRGQVHLSGSARSLARNDEVRRSYLGM